MDYSYSFSELVKSIDHWNEYRVPILRISHPDKNLNFQGAMRFYFQDAGQKVATKCVNVTSSDTTKDVIDVLIEKFRPDMRMLSVPEYGLYEIHENGDERKLDLDERPLLVQLEWNKDDREGRFLLRRMDEKTRTLAASNEEPSLKRKLSKKEKKKHEKLLKQQQKEQEKANAAATKLASKNKNGIAERLYNELPETSFTRSISNPEAVMKRRRAQKLEKRLQEFSLEGGQEAGGTLRIFGETINKDVSYKTLLLSTKDTASYVVKQILEKYGKEDEDPNNYCLVQLIVPLSTTANGGDNNSLNNLKTSSGLRESILDDNDCPLLINQLHDKTKGILTFHIRQKPADFQRRKKKKPSRSQVQGNPLHPLVVQQLNQRLQINNNQGQYSNQNSPQASSQTSGSVSHDIMNPPPQPFETVHSVPTMFHSSNGTLQYPQQLPPQRQLQQQSIPAEFIPPPRMNPVNPNQIVNNIPNLNGTIPRQNYSQPNMVSNHIVQNGHFATQNHQMPPSYNHVQGANNHILPALIYVEEDVEDIFLDHVITNTNPANVAHRLSPTYVLYMVSRFRASTTFQPDLPAPSRAQLFVPFTRKIASMIRNTIEIHRDDPLYMAFWLANSSDLNHFYKQDRQLSPFTLDAREILYESIKASFRYFLNLKQLELSERLYSFFDERNDQDTHQIDPRSNVNGRPEVSAISPLVNILDQTLETMRKNRVNASITIQIFSNLFHHISKWLFDRLIGVYDRPMNPSDGRQENYSVYCNRFWGERLSHRLAAIGHWAESHGIEQTADIHLARASQVIYFLSQRYPHKPTIHDLKESCDKCDRLNPTQLKALLQRYQPEHPSLRIIIEEYLGTMNYRFPTNEFPLEEDSELRVPFLIPDECYSSDMIRYIPKGLLEFISYLSRIRVGNRELCIFSLQPTSCGFWNVYFKNHQPGGPEIIVIQLRKKNNSMGLSIIAARGLGQERQGIYIKNVVKNGAAAIDGRLHAGDQLLEVDGNSLSDISQEHAAELMQRTGNVVTLRVAKQAAIHHDLSDIINNNPTQSVASSHNQVPPNHYMPHIPIPPPILENEPPQASVHQIHPQMIHQIPPRHHPKPPIMTAPIQHDRPIIPAYQDRASQPTIDSDQFQSNQIRLMNDNQSHVSPPDRQVHFQPTPGSMIFKDPIPSNHNSTNPTSPVKSPKKVSWVDNQPHQSLHTLIPPSPSLVSSPPAQMPSPPAEMQSPSLEQNENGYGDESYNLNNQENVGQMLDNGYPNESDIIEAEEQMGVSMSLLTMNDGVLNNNNDQHVTNNNDLNLDLDPDMQQVNPMVNGQTKSAPESLTLEDIDEVLSSKTHNNWLEDSAGVIGTQEVYNDPRQRIVKQRERPEGKVDSNKEKLTVQEKIRMFSIQNQE